MPGSEVMPAPNRSQNETFHLGQSKFATAAVRVPRGGNIKGGRRARVGRAEMVGQVFREDSGLGVGYPLFSVVSLLIVPLV